MKFDQAKELLVLISDIDRRPFPEGAAAIWFEMLRTVHFEDAKQAIHEHYTSLGARDGSGNARPVLPVDVKSRAKAIAEVRARASMRHALPEPAQRLGSTGRPAHVEAELARARLIAARASEKYAEVAA
jgi:hypothetical protein